MDAATIVSVYPFDLREVKPGIYPGTFEIPRSEKGDFQTLVVEGAKSFVSIDIKRPPLTHHIMAMDLARSIVQDLCEAKLAYSEGSGPGLAWVEGAFSYYDRDKEGKPVLNHDKKIAIRAALKEYIEIAAARQQNWAIALVRLADDDWTKYRQHKMISDEQRWAAKELGLMREWALSFQDQKEEKCPACSKFNPSTNIVCQNCHMILKEEEAKKLGLKFAIGA